MHETNRQFIELAKRSGWNQSEIARRLRKSAGLISQYHSGMVKTPESVLDHFCTVLQIEKSGAPIRESQQTSRNHVLLKDKDDADIVQRISELEPAEKEHVKEFVNYLYSKSRRKRK